MARPFLVPDIMTKLLPLVIGVILSVFSPETGCAANARQLREAETIVPALDREFVLEAESGAAPSKRAAEARERRAPANRKAFWWLGGLAAPWIFALVTALIPRRLDRLAAPVGLVGSILTAVMITGSMVQKLPSGTQETLLDLPWVPDLGLHFIVLRDGLSAMFAVLVGWIAVLTTLFAWKYLPHANRQERSELFTAPFYAAMSLFTAAMLALVSSGNLLQLYLFWELASIASFLLIGYQHHENEARKGAFLALGFTVAGSIFMVAGFLWLGIETGRWTIPSLLASPDDLKGELWLEACTALILSGALAKSAQFPFSGWLPAAMHAPTPVSAFLHSSALLSAGVYLLARFHFLMHTGTAWWFLLVITGAAGVIYAGLFAFRQEKMKPLLAYSTIGQFAFMFLAFGLGTRSAVKAAVYAFFVHSLIKAGLFLAAGSVTHITGNKAFEKIGGLIHSNRWLAVLTIFLGLSLAGLPPLGAFYYEEKLIRAAKEANAWGLYGAMFVGGLLSFAYMLRFLREIFLSRGKIGEVPRVPFTMGLPIGILAGALLVTAVFPEWMGAILIGPALDSILAEPVHFQVKIHFGPVFWSSIGTILLGVALMAARLRSGRARRWWRAFPLSFSLGGGRMEDLYGRVSEKLLSLHTGDLRFYLRVVFGASLVLIARFWWGTKWTFGPSGPPFDAALTAVLALTVMSAAATLWARYLLTFVLVLTMSGFAMGAAFVLMGAPKIALAQILVETLIDLSIILALRETFFIDPDRTRFLKTQRPEPVRWIMALGIGAVVGLGTYWATQTYPPDAVGQWYAHEGFLKSGSKDFIGAILADFRALDTLVEILVFTAGIFAVIGLYWHEAISGE